MNLQNKKTIYKCYVGSIAHNLYLPPSDSEEFGTCDKDTMEFYVFDKQYYLGLNGYHRRADTIDNKKDDIDMVGHELRKAFNLLAQGNPNLLVTLFNNPKNIIEMSTGGKMLLYNKDLFLSAKNIRNRFVGYAYSQLHRIEKAEYHGFMGDKRKKIVDKYGYDTKNAMTLIRLLREGIELLTTGNLTVYKTDKERELLLDIKQAKYSLKEIKEMADDLFEQIDQGYQKTVLPELIQGNKIDKLLVSILELEVL